MELQTTLTIEVSPEETLTNIRKQLPFGGDWALIRDGEEAVLWIDITRDGKAYVSDFNGSRRIYHSEAIHSLISQYLANVAA